MAASLSFGTVMFEPLGAQETRVAGRSVVRLEARAAIADGLLLVIDYGESSLVVVGAMTSPGEMGQFEETVLAMAASIEYAPAWRARFQAHTDYIKAVAFSPDGTLIASASSDETVRLWAFDGAWQQKATLKGHTDWVRAVAFSPDGALLGSAADDGSVILWDVPR